MDRSLGLGLRSRIPVPKLLHDAQIKLSEACHLSRVCDRATQLIIGPNWKHVASFEKSATDESNITTFTGTLQSSTLSEAQLKILCTLVETWYDFVKIVASDNLTQQLELQIENEVEKARIERERAIALLRNPHRDWRLRKNGQGVNFCSDLRDEVNRTTDLLWAYEQYVHSLKDLGPGRAHLLTRQTLHYSRIVMQFWIAGKTVPRDAKTSDDNSTLE